MESLSTLERVRRRRTKRRHQQLKRRALLAVSVALTALASAGEPQVTRVSQTSKPTLLSQPLETLTSPQPKSEPLAPAAARCPLPSPLRPLFVAASDDTGLPLALLTAVAYVESRFEDGAESSAGAYGLMQLMPETAAALGVDAFDPAANVLGGARYLHEMLHRFDSLELALATYNAGPTIVARVGGAPSKETRDYVFAVSSRYREQQGCR
jgi:soluble lytic murein transglycosylase-like protein